jgi:hypothetical protein
MEIIFSRHSKRRAKLYNIDLEDITEIIQSSDINETKEEQEIEIIDDKFLQKYELSMKIVVKKEGDKIVVITNYPLKRGRNEN